jgi:ribosomal protein S18 acetylase RimI-like enzyme
MSTPQIRAARPEDCGPLASTLARAFADDAVFDWCLRTDRRGAAIASFFESALAEAVERESVWTDEDLRACAVWTPSGTPSAPPSLWYPPELVWLLRLAGWRRLLRLQGLFRTIAAAQPREPHLALTFIGVHPAAQGGGLANALIRHRLEQLDRAGRPAYLETVDSSNVPFYERHGFVRTGAFRLSGSVPEIHQMWRAPVPTKGA